MKKIYFFSGLGADERVFQYLDLSFCNPVFIKWDLPLENESIEDYALRISKQVTEKNPVLAGVSFGGMMAVEVAKIIKPEKVILISSAKTKQELPSLYRMAGKMQAHKLLPFSALTHFSIINHFLFSVTSKENQKLLNEIIKDTAPAFLKWAIDKIVHWQNETIPENTIHIHGTNDRILPYKYVQADISIENAGHFMIVEQSPKISKLLIDLCG